MGEDGDIETPSLFPPGAPVCSHTCSLSRSLTDFPPPDIACLCHSQSDHLTSSLFLAIIPISFIAFRLSKQTNKQKYGKTNNDFFYFFLFPA